MSGTDIVISNSDNRSAIFIRFISIIAIPFLLGAGCHPSPRIRRIFLISLDAARWDFLPRNCGNDVGIPTSMPHLDRLCRESIVFTRAYTPFPTTTPAIASLYTGTHPLHHRLLLQSPVLSPAYITLAEQLQAYRFRTYLLTGNTGINDLNLFTQGFDIYDNRHPHPLVDKRFRTFSPEWMLFRTLDHLPELCKRRCFVHLHFIQPHSPYGAPARFFEKYPGKEFSSIPTEVLLELNKRQVHANQIPRQKLQRILEHYRAGLRWVDTFFGEFYRYLERNGWLQSSLIIFTADHGEAFGEHGSWTHNGTVYEEMTHIPLAIRVPDKSPSVISHPVQLEDLYSTILYAVNPDKNWYIPFGGLPLFDVPYKKISHRKTALMIASGYLDGPIGVVAGSYKVIYHRAWKMVSVYNLREDPYERSNRSALLFEIARRYIPIITAFTNRLYPLSHTPHELFLNMSDEKAIRRELERLGYVGIRYQPAPLDFDLLPHPLKKEEVNGSFLRVQVMSDGNHQRVILIRLLNQGPSAWPHRAFKNQWQMQVRCFYRDTMIQAVSPLPEDVYPGETVEVRLKIPSKAIKRIRCALEQKEGSVFFSTTVTPS